MSQPNSPNGLLLATAGLSCAALLLGAYAALRPAAAPVGDAAAIAELREELAALRHSVEVTRGQLSTPSGTSALADVEQRLMRVEATARAAALRPVSSVRSSGTPGAATAGGDEADAGAPDAEERMLDGSSRYVSLSAPNRSVAVEQLADGALVVRNQDPALTGTAMVVQGRTADGRDEAVTVTIPPPGS